MVVTNVAFRGNGFTVTFDDGSVANGLFKVINGVLTIVGLTEAQEAAFETFSNAIDVIDPRFSPDLTSEVTALQDNDGDWIRLSDNVQTIDETPTTISTITLSENTTYCLRAKIVGRNTTTPNENTSFVLSQALAYRDSANSSAVLLGAPVIYQWSTTPTTLSNPSELPPSGASVNWSPDGKYVAIGHNTSPFITIYERDGDTFTKLANPSSLPPNRPDGLAFSSVTGRFLALANISSPYIVIYERNGNTFTKLDDPGTLPAGPTASVTWSPNEKYLAITHQTSPFVTIYERNGTTFTKLADPSSLPANTGRGLAWSPDGELLVVSHNDSPYVTIYEQDGATFTKLADPSSLPAGNGSNAGVDWTPQGDFLSIAHATSPFVTVYKRDGTTFTKLTDPGDLPSVISTSTSWSPDGEFLLVGDFSAAKHIMYQRSGLTLAKVADLSVTIGPSPTADSAWAPNGQYLAITHPGNSPNVYFVKSDLSTSRLISNTTGLADQGNFTKISNGGALNTNVIIEASGDNVILQVVGESGQTYNWSCQLEIISVE